jgi:hypothetical protein
MRTISAKFASSCAGCGKPIAERDEVRYDDAARKVYHMGCEPEEKPGPEAFALAERLLFIRPGDPIPALLFTWNPAAPVRESETLSLFE